MGHDWSTTTSSTAAGGRSAREKRANVPTHGEGSWDHHEWKTVFFPFLTLSTERQISLRSRLCFFLPMCMYPPRKKSRPQKQLGFAPSYVCVFTISSK